MVDSHLPRFSQGVMAMVIVLAYLLDVAWLIPILAVLLVFSVVGGPRWNAFGYAYRALPIPRGEPEQAAPPRFAQTLGVIFLTVATVGLFTADPDTSTYTTLGWGPALLVAVLAGLAATTSF